MNKNYLFRCFLHKKTLDKQILRVMRITYFLFLLSLLSLNATTTNGQNAKVTLNKHNVSLHAILTEIEKQTDYLFVYDKQVDTGQTVSIDVNSQNLKETLEQLLNTLNISFSTEGSNIVLRSIEKDPAQSARKKISGVVRDVNGEAVIGASVKIGGTSVGTVTDVNGEFSLDVPKEAQSLQVSYIGMRSMEVEIGDKSSFELIMQEDVQMIGEVVVTALGIKKEAKALSYNVQEVKASEVVGVKDANFMNSLAGKVAGVVINASSSGIGGGAKVVMRGAKSISGNNNALYVIDGIPMPSLDTTQPSDHFTGMGQSGDGASMINPEDIETISVLSGAAASALYGSEAANGVIMITTKKGEKDKLNVSYSNNTSFYNPFITPEFQNTYGATSGTLQSWGQKLAQPSDYDPLDFFQTGWNVMNSLTVSNGNEKNQTFLSLASTNAEGIVMNNTLDRYNFSIRNTSSMLEGKLRLDLSANYMNIREQNMISQGQYFNPIVSTYLMSPSYSLETYQLFEMYDESRGFKTQYWPWGNMGLGMQNPYWVVNRDNFVNHKNRYLVSGGLNYDVAEGITLGARAKMDYTSAIFEKKYSASTDPIFAGKYGAYYKAQCFYSTTIRGYNGKHRQVFWRFLVG